MLSGWVHCRAASETASARNIGLATLEAWQPNKTALSTDGQAIRWREQERCSRWSRDQDDQTAIRHQSRRGQERGTAGVTCSAPDARRLAKTTGVGLLTATALYFLATRSPVNNLARAGHDWGRGNISAADPPTSGGGTTACRYHLGHL